MIESNGAHATGVDPRIALALFAVVVIVGLGLFWPRLGLLSRWLRARRRTERVRLEDALKQLYHATSEGGAAGADRLAGALEIPRDRALEVLSRLQAEGLAIPEGDGALLTEKGRRYALRILRSHRLLESYLADRTGVRPEEWHRVAEEREHDLDDDEVEDLASRIGQPRYDPHGDPIPTAEGELPDPRGVALSALAPGDAGVVVHLEDEPAEAFERLRSAGLALGKLIVLRSIAPAMLEIEIDGRVVTIPRVFSPAVTVAPRAAQRTRAPHTLADLSPGGSGRVVRVASICSGAQRRRLLDLGIVPGTEIGVEFRSVSGDPVAYRVRGALIALRRSQAVWVELEPPSEDAAGTA